MRLSASWSDNRCGLGTMYRVEWRARESRPVHRTARSEALGGHETTWCYSQVRIWAVVGFAERARQQDHDPMPSGRVSMSALHPPGAVVARSPIRRATTAERGMAHPPGESERAVSLVGLLVVADHNTTSTSAATLSCARGRNPHGPRPAFRGARSCRSPSSGTIARSRGPWAARRPIDGEDHR
jgi:hypothetical protein